jgi:hypothetical protein
MAVSAGVLSAPLIRESTKTAFVHPCLLYLIQIVKSKATTLQVRTGPYGFRSLRLSEFLDNVHMKVARLSALRNGQLYPSADTPGTHVC